MRRLASAVAVAVLALRAPAVHAEPLDVDLVRLGAPDPRVWGVIGERTGTPVSDPELLAREAKQRFAILSSEVALALSSAILQPASTTGHAGFDFGLEASYAPVHGDPVGSIPPPGFSNAPWTTRSTTPASLTMTGVRVRKALPFSFELGGRLTYLTRSSYLAAQGEAKWALNEGFDQVPDLAVRAAHTRLFGQRDWNLSATDVDFMVSKRWGVNAVTSFTPYVALRFTYVNASTDLLDFAPPEENAAPDEVHDAVARFPELRAGFYRTTFGLRMTAHAVSLAAEGTYFGGKKYSGKAAPAAHEYGSFRIASSLSGALKLGWEF
jgi:hypothetical protein